MATYASGVLAPFAVGNAAPGGRSSIEGVREDMARRVAAMAAAMPPEVKARFHIVSGYRDAARQAEVNPGVTNSRHMHGAALDLGNDPVVLDWIGQHPEYGLGFPLRSMGPKEYNHLEMLDSAGNRASIGNGPIGGRIPGPADLGSSPTPTTYADTGDPQFKSGLAVPQAPPDTPDPARQAAIAALALQQQQTGPFAGPSSLGDAFAQTVKAGQPPVQPPSTILGAPQYPNVGGPVPLARRIG